MMHFLDPKHASPRETNHNKKFIECDPLFCLLVKYAKDVNILNKTSRKQESNKQQVKSKSNDQKVTSN